MIPEIARKIIILTLVLLIIKRLIKIKNREHFRQTTTDFTPSTITAKNMIEGQPIADWMEAYVKNNDKIKSFYRVDTANLNVYVIYPDGVQELVCSYSLTRPGEVQYEGNWTDIRKVMSNLDKPPQLRADWVTELFKTDPLVSIFYLRGMIFLDGIYLKWKPNVYFTIKHFTSGACLVPEGAKGLNGTPIGFYNNCYENDLTHFVKRINGSIEHRRSGKCLYLDTNNLSAPIGTRVVLKDCPNQSISAYDISLDLRDSGRGNSTNVFANGVLRDYDKTLAEFTADQAGRQKIALREGKPADFYSKKWTISKDASGNNNYCSGGQYVTVENGSSKPANGVKIVKKDGCFDDQDLFNFSYLKNKDEIITLGMVNDLNIGKIKVDKEWFNFAEVFKFYVQQWSNEFKPRQPAMTSKTTDTYVEYKNRDIACSTGQCIQKIDDISVDNCSAMCNSNSKCTGFVSYKSEIPSPCWLMSGTSNMVQKFGSSVFMKDNRLSSASFGTGGSKEHFDFLSDVVGWGKSVGTFFTDAYDFVSIIGRESSWTYINDQIAKAVGYIKDGIFQGICTTVYVIKSLLSDPCGSMRGLIFPPGSGDLPFIQQIGKGYENMCKTIMNPLMNTVEFYLKQFLDLVGIAVNWIMNNFVTPYIMKKLWPVIGTIINSMSMNFICEYYFNYLMSEDDAFEILCDFICMLTVQSIINYAMVAFSIACPPAAPFVCVLIVLSTPVLYPKIREVFNAILSANRQTLMDIAQISVWPSGQAICGAIVIPKGLSRYLPPEYKIATLGGNADTNYLTNYNFKEDTDILCSTGQCIETVNNTTQNSCAKRCNDLGASCVGFVFEGKTCWPMKGVNSQISSSTASLYTKK